MSFPPPTPLQARILWMALTGLSIGVLLAVIALFGWGAGWLVRLLSPVLWPLALSGIIAYLLDPMVDFFIKRNVPRARAIILVFAICLGVVLAVFSHIVPRLVFETQRFVEEVPALTSNVKTNIANWVSTKPMLVTWKDRFFPPEPRRTNAMDGTAVGTNEVASVPGRADPPAAGESSTIDRLIEGGVQWAAKTVPLVGAWLLDRLKTVASWAGMIVGLALVPVFVFYMLLEKKGIQRTWSDYLPITESKLKEEVVFVISAINEYLIVFFRGQIVVAMCIGALLAVGFMSIGLHYAVLLGILAGALSIVPYLGAIMTIIPALILASVQFKDWLHPILIVAIFAVVQTLEGLVISPKVMGDRVGLHPMTIIIAVLAGTTLLGGILGGVLAIPLTAALRVVMFRYVWKARPVARAATTGAAD